jgi:uncharacterized RDD family membrane protein YckC
MSDAPAAYRFAGFWIRFLAFVIDGVIIGVVGYAIIGPDTGAAGDWIGMGGQKVAYTDDAAPLGSGQMLGQGANTLVDWLYFSLFESSAWSATPGKKALGLIVVDDGGRRISFLRATGRYFAKILSAVPLLLGFLCVGWNRRKRGLHDVIAGTLVLRRDVGGERIVPPDAIR